MIAITQVNKSNKMPPVAANGVAPQDQQQCPPSMTINVQIQDGLARIVLSGRFGFEMRRNFRNAYVSLIDNTTVKEIWVDMSKVDYLDSSALGMLLLLNERAHAINKSVVLLTVPGVVLQILEVANFSKIFNIKNIGPESRSLSGRSPFVVNNFPLRC